MEEYQVQLTMAINILSWSQRMQVSAWVDVRIALGLSLNLCHVEDSDHLIIRIMGLEESWLS